MSKRWLLAVGLCLLAAGGVLVVLAWPGDEHPTPAPVAATRTPEPIIPTRTASVVAATAKPTATSSVTITPTERAAPTATVEATDEVPTATETVPPPSTTPTSEPAAEGPAPVDYASRPRWGIGVSIGPLGRYDVGALRLGWYLNWRTQANPARPGGAEYAQMVRLQGGALRPDVGTIAEIARANPGSLWLISNEPDVRWQDNVAPGVYARLYHQAYGAIKGADPTARVAAGGISQPTPLRMRYLDAVLEAYRQQTGTEMPMDVWNVHNFVLREERDSWGVDIPPGFGDQHGKLYEVDDGGNLELFREQIGAFRRWMAQRGYQNKPLIVSEYGILMPEDYGFPPERVAEFMTGTFDFFLSAADGSLGYPRDGYRLVQRWCWYSLDSPDTYYPTGRLFDPETGAMTLVGQRWAAYVAGR